MNIRFSRATRIGSTVTVTFLLMTLAPFFSLLAGMTLNALWNCDIRDESGEVYGTCSTDQAGIVYSLMIMMWFMLITMPTAGVATVAALIVTAILALRDLHNNRRKQA